MRIYLAARYSRRLELCGYRDQLHALGHEVTSCWLNGAHQIGTNGTPIGDKGEALVEHGTAPAELRQRFAQDDFRDVSTAQLLIAFTEAPGGGGRNRGGRHVEMGIALGNYILDAPAELACQIDSRKLS